MNNNKTVKNCITVIFIVRPHTFMLFLNYMWHKSTIRPQNDLITYVQESVFAYCRAAAISHINYSTDCYNRSLLKYEL